MKKKLIFLIISLFLFTGCYDYNELNDLAIVSGMAVAYNNKKYETTFEIIMAKKNDSGKQEESKTMLITGNGDTVPDAINNTIGKVDKRVLLSQLQVVLLDESVAKKGIKDVSNYFFRDIHVSNNFYYVLAKDTDAKKILKAKIKNEPIVTNAILDLFNNQNSTEQFDLQSEFDYLYAKLKDGKEDIIIPSLTYNNDNIALGTLGIFKKDKLIDYLTKNESETYYLLKSKVENTFYHTKDTAIAVYKNTPKFKIQDNTMKVSLNAEAIIKCLNKETNLRDGKTNKELSISYSQKIKKQINELIKTSIDKDSDFLGLGSIYYRKYPHKYQKDIWKDLKYKVNVNLEVNRNGQTFEVIN